MTTCRACGSTRLTPVFEMEPMPLAAAYTATAEEARALPKYPLSWLWCARCGLVNVTPDIPDDELYRHYQYAASEVPALVRHHAAFADFLRARHPGNQSLLEIGCNDGVLMRQLPLDWHVIGVDPSDVALESFNVGNAGGWLIAEPFTSALVQRLGQFDIVTTSNSLAHFTEIGDAIEGIREALAPGGVAYVEVHDLDATLRTGQWDTVYHEHKVEWSADSLRRAFAIHGLEMRTLAHLPLHGGLLRASFVRGRHHFPLSGPTMPDFWRLIERYEDRRDTDAYRAMTSSCWAYGAAARASVYLNQTGLPVEYVVDGSPRRQYQHIPGTGAMIVPPETFDGLSWRPPTLITAWNHADDIKARHPDYDGWVTAW
jgi:SAM-dependent methyltransferase